MTAITAAMTDNFLMRGLSNIVSAIGNTLSTIGTSIINARQEKAYYEIAVMLHATEYRNESFYWVHRCVREGKIDQINGGGVR